MTEDQVIAALRAVSDAGRAYRRRRMLMVLGFTLSVWIVTDLIDLLLPGGNLALLLALHYLPAQDAACAALALGRSFF